MFLTEDHVVFVNGKNNVGQLGMSSSESCVTTPVALSADKFDGQCVVAVGANNTHSVFITREHRVSVKI